jgi:hypothetical protein
VVILIPAEQVTGRQTRIRIEADIKDPQVDAYMPYAHWAYQGTFQTITAADKTPVAEFGEQNTIHLLDYTLKVESGQLRVDLTWDGPAPQSGDGIVFIHLYNDINVKPVAQRDQRPMGGVLPPGNWLPGILHDSYTVDLSQVPPGTYTVAIGLYEARTRTRYPVSGAAFDSSTGEGAQKDRLFIGKITVEEPTP